MIRIDPTKILVGGDKNKARTFIGPAKSQLEILKNQMKFQNLKQGLRRLWLNDNVYVECRKIFNYQECRIWVRPTIIVESKKETKRYFLVVFSTGSGNEAIVWDLLSDSVFLGIDEDTGEAYTKTEIESFFNRYIVESSVPDFIEAEYPETNSHSWLINYPTDSYDAPLILPDYLFGYYAISGFYYVFSHLYPAVDYDLYLDGLVKRVYLDFDYIAESPLPHPNKSVLSTTAPQDEDAEQASYIMYFQGSVNSDSELVPEFESLTGKTWPENVAGVFRIYQFWHPFFWYSNTDGNGSYDNLSAEGRGILLADTWRDGEWIGEDEDLELSKSSLTWQTAGIATIDKDSEGELLDDPQVLLFEYVSVCHKFVDTFGTGMCDTDLCDFDQYFRIYEHGKVSLTGLKKEIFDLGNAKRLDNGKELLVFNSVLSESAQRHAEDMASYFTQNGDIGDGHTGTDGTTPTERIYDAGYFLWIEDDLDKLITETSSWGFKISENSGYVFGTNVAESYMDLVQNSSEHLANMLDEDLSEIGIGISTTTNNAGDTVYIIIQNFGRIDHRYPGFSPFNTENLQAYINENFTFDPVYEDTRVPKLYLLGSIELTDAEYYQLTGQNQV